MQQLIVDEDAVVRAKLAPQIHPRCRGNTSDCFGEDAATEEDKPFVCAALKFHTLRQRLFKFAKKAGEGIN